MVDDYQRRPEDREDVCLAEFVSAYTKKRERKRHFTLNESVTWYGDYGPHDVLNHQREQVMLYVPFRNEHHELLGNNAYVR